MTDATIEAPHEHHHVASDHEIAARAENLKMATWLFLASEVVIFSVLIAIYFLFRLEFPERVKEVHETAGVFLVAINTFLLLTSSWTMVMGLRAISKDNRQGLIQWFSFTAVLGTVFLGLQFVEYNTLSAEGITLYGDSFGMRFYAPTAFHGFHVFIGVVWSLLVINHARKGGYSKRDHIGVEVFGLYWHFVDVVWIILFTVIYLL